jgi:hypothetical protein
MIFNAFQREDDDAVFTVARNVSGGTFALGEVAVWDISASVDGVRVSVPATATLSLFRGVAGEAVVDSAYGRFQVHGYNANALVTNTTNTAIAAGNILIPVDAVKYLARTGASDGKSGFVYAAEAVATAATPAAAAHKVLIRAL